MGGGVDALPRYTSVAGHQAAVAVAAKGGDDCGVSCGGVMERNPQRQAVVQGHGERQMDELPSVSGRCTEYGGVLRDAGGCSGAVALVYLHLITSGGIDIQHHVGEIVAVAVHGRGQPDAPPDIAVGTEVHGNRVAGAIGNSVFIYRWRAEHAAHHKTVVPRGVGHKRTAPKPRVVVAAVVSEGHGPGDTGAAEGNPQRLVAVDVNG